MARVEQRKTPRMSGVLGKATRRSAESLVIVKRDEAPENRGLGAGGIAEAHDFGGVDRGRLWGGRLEGVGGDGDGTAQQGGFFAATRGRASGTAGEEGQRSNEDEGEGELSFHQQDWGKSVSFKRWNRTKKGGLPREKHFIQRRRGVRELGELGTIGNQRGFDSQRGGDAIPVFFDAIETGEFGLGKRATLGVAPWASREGFGIAFKTSAKCGAKRADEAVVAFTEIDLGEDGFLGLTVFGGVGDVEEEVVIADFERRGVDALGAGLAPMPDGVEHR